MIVLKHLCQQYGIDPYIMRRRLRRKFGKKARWQWPDENDPELKAIRSYLDSGKTTSGSPGSSAPTTPSSPAAGQASDTSSTRTRRKRSGAATTPSDA